MKKKTGKQQQLIGTVLLMAATCQLMAAEFVVQTDLDTGGGQVITEISPNVFSIDTLRSAIEQANDEITFPGPDTISFDQTLITANAGNVTTILLSQVGDQFNFQTQSSDSALGINSTITIQGPTTGGEIHLSANGLRHFQVNSGGRLRLYDLTLRDGETPLNSAGRGGAVVVANNAQLETQNTDFSFNQAVNGGALAFQSGSLAGLIENTLFFFNSASDNNPSTSSLGQGGAIFADTNSSLLIIENTSFSFNNADADAGAMYIDRPFEVLSSRFTDNEATLNGGALYASEQAQFIISNSVFYDNLSRLRGGAIYTRSNTVNPSQIFNSTLAENNAGFDLVSQPLNTFSRGASSSGGAIYSAVGDNLIMHNNIVAKNEEAGTPDDISAELLEASSFNLIGVSGTIFGVTDNTNGNLIGTVSQPIDPALKLSQISTLIGLLSNSPAINSGSNVQVTVAGLNTDIEGNDRVIGSAVDRGAFETDVLFYNGFE